MLDEIQVRAVRDSIVQYIKVSMVLLLLFIPLGMWKLIDILVWLFKWSKS